SLLRQEAARGTEKAAGSLGQLFNGVFQGHATRDLGRDEPADGDWTTVRRSFVVRRRTVQQLGGATTEVNLGAATLSAPGLSGTATTHFGTKGREVAASLLNDNLRNALAASGMLDGQTVELADAQQTGPSTRSLGDQPAMELRLNAPAEGFGQVVLATDEAGVVTWHVAIDGAGTRGAAPSAQRRYLVPQSVPTEQAADTRGLLGVLGKKILKELVFPLVDPIAGEIGAMFVNAMEKSRWPYRIRHFTPNDYTLDAAPAMTGDDWRRLSRGRALLFVHGTFSRAHLAFSQLPVDYMTELHRRYDGRVFAFDHFTLSHDPRENIRQLLTFIPDGTTLDVDIVCHSRGGLVSRVLSERLSEFDMRSRSLRVNRIVFVGAPNAGTPLADPKRMGDLLDIFTNAFDYLPDNGVTDVLSMILSVVKQLAVGTLKGLDGLQSMYSESEYAKQMNSGARHGDTKYFAITSNARPSEPGLKRLIVTKGLNTLMGGANDLVVPTEGVFKENGSGYFPIEDKLVLEGSDGVSHTHYFASDSARRRMLEWLGG
ncbi:MAG: alpha/beta hydrolase, partial [Gemmatimonadota bacterium]